MIFLVLIFYVVYLIWFLVDIGRFEMSSAARTAWTVSMLLVMYLPLVAWLIARTLVYKRKTTDEVLT